MLMAHVPGRLPTRSNVEVRLLPPESGGGWGPQSLALDTTSGDYRRFLYYTSGRYGGRWPHLSAL